MKGSSKGNSSERAAFSSQVDFIATVDDFFSVYCFYVQLFIISCLVQSTKLLDQEYEEITVQSKWTPSQP